MYFYYGITHSSLENPTEEIELTVDTSFLDAQQQQKQSNDHHHHHQPPTAVWDRHGYENKMAEDSWSTNNYTTTTSSWDVNETNNAWNNPSGNNLTHRQPQPAPATKPKPSQPPKPSVVAATAKKPSTAPQGRQQQQQQQFSQPPKEGFGSIFVDESEFPSWDD